MRNAYTNEIAELHKWVESTNYQLGTGLPFLHTEAEVQTVRQRIYYIMNYIQEEYPFYFMPQNCKRFHKDRFPATILVVLR